MISNKIQDFVLTAITLDQRRDRGSNHSAYFKHGKLVVAGGGNINYVRRQVQQLNVNVDVVAAEELEIYA
jgi:hypothetical protein